MKSKVTKHRILWGLEIVLTTYVAWIVNTLIVLVLSQMSWHPVAIVCFAAIGFTGALLLTWELFNPKDLIKYDPNAQITLHSLLNSLLLSILCGVLAPVIWVMVKAGKTDT
jgi:hypothetical protein